MTYGTPAPASGLADLLISVLERGIVLVLRLDGPPGDRHLVVGFGTTGAVDPLLLALGVTGHLGGRRERDWADWPDSYE